MWILFSLLHIFAVMVYFPCYLLYRFPDAIGPLLQQFPMLLLLLPKFSSSMSSTFNYMGFMTGRGQVLVLEDIVMNGIATGDLPERNTDNMGKLASSSLTMVICDLGTVSMALATLSVIQTLVHILSRSSKCIRSSSSDCRDNSFKNKDRGQFPTSLLSPEDLECHSDSSTYATASMWFGYSCILYAAASTMKFNREKSTFEYAIPLAMLVLMPMVQVAYVVYECGRTYTTFMRLAAFLTLILFLMTANAILEADQGEYLYAAKH
eukprot:CAMPEP_0185259636 /NCGR_PEP_ID=MMETSP1359-20130426/8382_1 /TAXON_ID=552665 /ORGANISM="Bigelowiella longifila, Strain CCMP242" /LENGTH=264 /DNA_ID=CAMNT_0027845611 /DNA_START=386 /DNA_END=1180 /DNA_ORIENTATION=+